MKHQKYEFSYSIIVRSTEEIEKIETDIKLLIDNYRNENDAKAEYILNKGEIKKFTETELLVDLVLLLLAPITQEAYNIFREKVIKPLVTKYKTKMKDHK